MKHFIAVLGILFLTFLWLLTSYLFLETNLNGFSVLFAADTALTILYGIIIFEWYKD